MEDADIALVVALSEEFETIKGAIGLSPYKSEDGIEYFSVSDGATQCKLVAYTTNEMGLVPTVCATDMLLDRINPKWLISIGLSGQLSTDCALGDVVIGTDCDLAFSEARLSVGGIDFAGKPYEVPGLQDFHKTVNLKKYLQGREPDIPLAAQKALDERRLWRKYPHIHSGCICSTDFVVDNPKAKALLLEKNRRYLCTDMESAALVSAARKRKFAGRIAVIRAVSDPADGTKKKIDELAGRNTIRHYAMRNAATLLKHAIIEVAGNAEEQNR